MKRDGDPTSQFLVYRDEAGRARIDVRFDGDTVWLTQAQLAELFGTTPQNMTQHIAAVYDDGELEQKATCKEYLQVRREGSRNVQRRLVHYNLDMIISVGYRVRSKTATAFRTWATQRLREYIVKGFVLDDERLANPHLPFDYFDELLERIQAIRTSERRFYQKITDVYATSIDYDPGAEITQAFFATVQNKLHWAITGQTAAEVVRDRADADKPNMGLTSWRGERIKRSDVGIAKNYYSRDELSALNNLVEQYLVFADGQARRRIPMKMSDWIAKLDGFLTLNDRDVLTSAGKVSHELAQSHAEGQFERFTHREASAIESDFDRF
ncbi:MAG TPA: virulence RhuM family protein, partial [Ilumatobacteraceae bacterium]|nr:virulence RhuM family protein [Ilumatobacteraceae bacterium]